jgi:hypothetical protein
MLHFDFCFVGMRKEHFLCEIRPSTFRLSAALPLNKHEEPTIRYFIEHFYFQGDIYAENVTGIWRAFRVPFFVSCLQCFVYYVSSLCANDDSAAITFSLHNGALLAVVLLLCFST